MDDSEMISRIKQGERELFDPLMERYYDQVYYFCRYKIGDEDQAYDCTQETFLKVVRYLDSYTDKNKFKPWLFRIAANICNDYFRERPRACESDEALDTIGIEDRNLDKAELEDVLPKALSRLPDYQREAVVLKYIYDFKLREIAGITGAGLPAVKSRVKQGLDKLKKILREEGFAE